MGAADFNTGATIQGTRDEVFAILKVFHSYATEKHEQYSKKRNCAYLNSVYVGGEKTTGLGNRINFMSDEQLLSMIEENNCTITVNASGPYGRFNSLEDVDLFRDVAEVAPNAKVSGGMGGFDPGGDQCATFELKDGLLYCKYANGYGDECWNDEDWDDDEDDWDEEEPNWDFEEVYDPIKKEVVETNYFNED